MLLLFPKNKLQNDIIHIYTFYNFFYISNTYAINIYACNIDITSLS